MIRMKLVATVLACLLSPLACATTVTTDFTDMWWVPAESGWGANVIQQGDTLFVTLFVYAPGGQPVWYVAPATTFQGTVSGAQRFTGPLYTVVGPYFANSVFDPKNVTAREVGSVTFSAPQVASATLSYTVDGVSVSKNVERQTWRNDNLAGSYIGATLGVFSGCTTFNGVSETGAVYVVTQAGTSVAISETGTSYTCSYNGTLTQNGRMGSVAGTGTCSDLGTQSQDFAATEVQAGLDFVSMRMDFGHGSCRFSGRLGGMRRVAAS